MLNDDKTKFIVMASRRSFKKLAVNTIRVADCDVTSLAWPYTLLKHAVPPSIT